MALNGTMPAFQLGGDGETSALCGPYPIHGPNRLVKEDMLLANYLMVQRPSAGLADLLQVDSIIPFWVNMSFFNKLPEFCVFYVIPLLCPCSRLLLWHV